MNSKLKAFLLISLKQAVNAVLVNYTASVFWPQVFHLHDWHGALNILKLIGAVIGAREIAVWGPVLLKWSRTGAEPDTSAGHPNG